MSVPVHLYLPYVGIDEDGSQILVQIFTDPQGLIELVQVARRGDSWESWGPPIRVDKA
jgi:hypothetical protein